MAIRKFRKQYLLGLIVEREGFLTGAQVSEVLERQALHRADRRIVPFGEVALELGLITAPQLEKALALQRKLAAAPAERKQLGFYLLEAGLVTPGQLDRAIELQTGEGGLLGEMLVKLGLLSPPALEMFLDLQAAERKRLGLYLLEARMVKPSQLIEALEEQQRSRRRLGEVLIERGWVNPESLDLVLKHQSAELLEDDMLEAVASLARAHLQREGWENELTEVLAGRTMRTETGESSYILDVVLEGAKPFRGKIHMLRDVQGRISAIRPI